MLIDSDKLKQAVLSIMPERSEVLLIVNNQPDAVVRCKDCRFSILIPPCNQRKCNGAMEKIVTNDFFCADGERR